MFPDVHDYDRTAPQIFVPCRDPMPASWAMPAPYEGVPERVRPALGFRTPFPLIWCRSPGGSPVSHVRIPVKTIYRLRIIRSGHASRAIATPWPPSAYGPPGPRPCHPSASPCVRLSTPTSCFTPRPHASAVAAHNHDDNGIRATQVRLGGAFARPRNNGGSQRTFEIGARGLRIPRPHPRRLCAYRRLAKAHAVPGGINRGIRRRRSRVLYFGVEGASRRRSPIGHSCTRSIAAP